MKALVVIPCGKSKVWYRRENHGPCKASLAYTGVPFKVNRKYAKRFGDRWVILSAKYGFIDPSFLIPGPYEVSFKKKSTNPVQISVLKRQVREMGLDGFGKVIVLGGKEYREAASSAFRPIKIETPFAGLGIGKAMQAIIRAIEEE